MEDSSSLRVEDGRLIKDESAIGSGKRALKFPLTPNNLGMYMKEYFGVGFNEHGWSAVLEQHGDDQILQSLLFMRMETIFRNMTPANPKLNADKHRLLVSSLAERIFLNFLIYADSRECLDGEDPLTYALTLTPTTDENGVARISSCGAFGSSGLRLFRGFALPRGSPGLAVGLPSGSSGT